MRYAVRVMLWLRLALLVLLLPLLLLGGMWVKWGRGLPSIDSLDSLEYSGITRVYDGQGQFLTTLSPDGTVGHSPTILSLGQMGPWLPKAVMVSEDRRFYTHGAVDFMGVLRGLLKGLLHKDLEGGSTITQQVVKNTLLRDLNSARTAERKFKEALLASRVERKFSKEQILTAYLNVVYWGHGGSNDLQGGHDAAQAYFRKPVAKLNLAESAYLATIIPAPNKRYHDFLGYRPLVKTLLKRMVEDKQITQAQADEAWSTPIYPSGWRINWGEHGQVISATFADENSLGRNAPQDPPSAAPYYLQALTQELQSRLAGKELDGGKVFTTLDMQAQRSANQASLHVRRMPLSATLGIALLDPQNGEVRALVGQKLTAGVRPPDWNNATQAKRQVGSSIKPLLYTLALSKGWKQSDKVLDSPIDDKDYQPKNYDGTYLGVPVTLRYALDHSLNLPTVRLGKEVGLDNFRAKLTELGMPPQGDLGLSLAIGTLEASPLQMAAAYAPFANGGIYHAPALVRRVEDSRGKAIYARSKEDIAGKRVWDAQTAWLGLDMIRGVVDDLDSDQGGLATRARIEGWQVGGKTGTTNDIKDLWFVGTTSRLTGAVWVGKQAGGSLPDWAYSGSIPAPIWQAAMTGALQGVKPVPFSEPSGIEYAVVRRVKMAFRAAPATPAAAEESTTPSWWPFGHKAPAQSESTTQPESTAQPAESTPAATPPAAVRPETATPPASTTPPATSSPAEATPDQQQPAPVQPTPAQPAPRVTLEPLPEQPTPTQETPNTQAQAAQPQVTQTQENQQSGGVSDPVQSAGSVQFQGNQGAVDIAPQH